MKSYEFLIENDSEHRDALKQTGFWGRQGAGCIFLALDTGRLCIAHRSRAVEQPGTWGTWGGAIDSFESPETAVRREVREESGYNGKLNLVPLYIFSHPSGFKYYNYLAVIQTEFTPEMDWETQGFTWCYLDNLPSPLHQGLVSLLSDAASLKIIKQYSKRPDEELKEEQLDELIGIKKKVNRLPAPQTQYDPNTGKISPHGKEWYDIMINHDFFPMGSGGFATVWEHPKLSYVLKVFTSDDIAYSEWITTARQHKNNPHMPQFISPRLMRVAPGVMAIRTERLTQIDQKVNAMLPAIDVLVVTATIDKRDPSEIIATALSGSGLSSRFTPLLDYCKVYPEFLSALDIVCKFARRPGFRPDIHDENIMMRGPVIVFTDPAFDKTALMNKQL